jgi:phytoene dehydrogenase-like protein
MKNNSGENTIIIIGAGFAGLGAGIYARMNGYRTRIFEMHDKPGGLCTSWSRKGYIFDGCIHWLVGSSPESAFNKYWEEVGIAQKSRIINFDEYMRFEGKDGRTVIFYSNVDRLEKHLLEISPRDGLLIKDFTSGIRMCTKFNQPSRKVPFLERIKRNIKFGLTLALHGRDMQKWMKTSAKDFANRFTDPLLREAFKDIWIPEFSMLFMLFTFAYLHNRNAGYPLGGSTPMSKALEERFLGLGGEIIYKKRVEKIIVENNRAVGIKLTDGSEQRASRIISAADGYSTIFKMLDGKFTDEKIREPYEKWPIFNPLIFVGLGIKDTFSDEPMTVSGFSIPLDKPEEIGDAVRERISVHIYNHDPSLAPEGKTSIVILLNSEYNYWEKLADDKNAYQRKKEEIASKITRILEQRYPGISEKIEVIDVATPLTFERYTGNWQGSFEGWLITPENSYVFMKRMSQQLPGLDNFYMCGQWTEPGGGLPTGIMAGQRLIRKICREDHKKFRSQVK